MVIFPILLALLISCSGNNKKEIGEVQSLSIPLPDIVREKCIMCHDTVERKVGPSFIQIKDKYKDDPEALKKLVRSIKRGSEGKWGRIPMMPNDVTEEEARKIAEWIMSVNYTK